MLQPLAVQRAPNFVLMQEHGNAASHFALAVIALTLLTGTVPSRREVFLDEDRGLTSIQDDVGDFLTATRNRSKDLLADAVGTFAWRLFPLQAELAIHLSNE